LFNLGELLQQMRAICWHNWSITWFKVTHMYLQWEAKLAMDRRGVSVVY